MITNTKRTGDVVWIRDLDETGPRRMVIFLGHWTDTNRNDPLGPGVKHLRVMAIGQSALRCPQSWVMV